MEEHLRRKRRYIFWSRVTGVAVVLFPLSIHTIDFRASFTQGVSVSANKASPAYAAFEDSREEYKQNEFIFPAGARHLTTGQAFDFKSAAERTVTVRQIAMRGLTIRAPSQAVPLAVPEQRVFVADGKITRRDFVASGVPAQLHGRDGELLPLNERKRNLTIELAQEDWTVPTPAARARELVREVLKPAPRPTPATVERLAPRPTIADVASVDLPHDSATAMLNIASVLKVKTSDPASLRPLWLLGQVEMTEGLAYVGPETQMTVKRVFNGYVYEEGRIWVSDGRFEIRVKEPVGYLVAELLTRDGRVLGRGEINLMDLRELPPREDRVANLRIPLRPTAEGASFRAISGYSHGPQKMAIAKAKVEIQSYSEPRAVNDEGFVTDPSLHRDSTFVARAVAENNWPSVVIGQARAPQDIRLFSNKLIQALIELSIDANNRVDRAEAKAQAVVWGRLLQEGQAVAAATVEMAGDYKPIYFNEMHMPDPRLHATSSNGLFAFIKVRHGVQAVRVRAGDKTYPAQVFPTENKNVSYVELDLRNQAVSQFKVFNAFDMQRPVVARVRMVGGDGELEIGKDDFVEYSVAANPFMVEADAGGEYEVSRVVVSGSPHVIHVPLVQRQWLYQLMQDLHVDQLSQRGVIVGLIDEPGYEVELTGYVGGEAMQVVYLDAQGRSTDSRVGLAGGGFAVFNAPAGLQTLFVHGAQSRQTFSQIVVAEPDFVSILTH